MPTSLDEGFSLCMLILSPCFLLQSVVNYVNYGEVDFFKAQIPIISLATATVLVLRAIELSLYNIINPYTCKIRVVTFICSLLFVVLFTLKCFQFWFRFEYANESLMYFRSESPKESKHWFRDHKHWANQRNLFRYFLFLTLLSTCLNIPSLLEASDDLVPNCSFYDNPGSRVCIVIVTFHLVGALTLAYKLRGSYDSLGIKTELILCSAVLLLGMAIGIGLVIVGLKGSFDDGEGANYNWRVTLMINLVYLLILCYKPHFERIRHSHANRRRESFSGVSLKQQAASPSYELSSISRPTKGAGKMRVFIGQKEGLEAFERYLIGEFGVESLHFWMQATDVLKIYNNIDKTDETLIDLLIEKMSFIGDQFLCPTSEFEVNLGPVKSDSFTSIVRLLECVTFKSKIHALQGAIALLEDAADEIFRLLSLDSFLRFSRGKVYRELAAKFSDQEILDLQCQQGMSVALAAYDAL